jgi:hypothetical protein
MYRYLLCFILLITTAATAQNPIPRQGDDCPSGTYKSGDYCCLMRGKFGVGLLRSLGSGWNKQGLLCSQFPFSRQHRYALARYYLSSLPEPLMTSGGDRRRLYVFIRRFYQFQRVNLAVPSYRQPHR